MSDERKPWERVDGETVKAYEAFRIYRDLGPERSMRKAGEVLGKSMGTLDRWTSRFDWRLRVEAYEDELERARLKERNESIAKMHNRHAQLSRKMQAKALKRLETLKPSELSPADLLKYVEVATKLERVSMGEPETIEERRTLEDPSTSNAREHLARLLDGVRKRLGPSPMADGDEPRRGADAAEVVAVLEPPESAAS